MKSQEDLYNFLLTKRPAELPLTKHDIELILSALEIMEQVAAQQKSIEKLQAEDDARALEAYQQGEKLDRAYIARGLYELNVSKMVISRQAMKLLKLAGVDLGIDFDKPVIN